MAIRKLLDTANHIRARAAELENALEALREQERSTAVKELLLALRNSPDGDLLRFNPAAPGDGGNSTAQAIIGALVEAFSMVPIRNIGERIAVRAGQIALMPGYASQRSFGPTDPRVYRASFRQATLGLGQLAKLFHSSLSF